MTDPKRLSDKKLIDWLAARSYVEATESASVRLPRGRRKHDLRTSLSRHIQGLPMESHFDDAKLVPLSELRRPTPRNSHG